MRRSVDGIRRLLNGEMMDFSTIALDMDRSGNSSSASMSSTRFIPCGETRTYGDIARASENRAPRAASARRSAEIPMR